jgi:formylglycine-generating enzyme required for sulfatase activity
MTQGQWKRLTGENPSAHGPDAGGWEAEWLASGAPPSLLHPVELVSWSECNVWLRRAGLSLPSEAQWERATRAGTITEFSTGKDDAASLLGVANLRDQHFKRAVKFEGWASHESFDDKAGVHWAVGTRRANGFGLHDVHGNVQEWCLDAYAPYHTNYSDRENPVVVETTLSRAKVVRGGSWRFRADEARSGDRRRLPPGASDSGMGVRPARAITDQ